MTATADSTARSSIMFAADQPNVVMFCDEGNHNRYAPTKHNQMCQRRSTLDVILKHADFSIMQQSTSDDAAAKTVATTASTIVDTTPSFEYKKRQLTRYVLIIDETKDSMVRESWSFLRQAIRKWVVYDLPVNTEVGIILANDTASEKTFEISSLEVQRNRDYIASFIPFSTSESQRPACINCAVRDAIHMLQERHVRDGPAQSVILIVAPGMDFSTDHVGLAAAADKAYIKIATINYPGVIRRQPLDLLVSKGSGGVSHTVYEKKQNGEKSYLTTYFELSNTFYSILNQYYEGNRLNLPIEIHRKELFDVSDDGTPSKRISRHITSAFMLDASMGTPSSFFIYTHSAENPLIQSAKLTSPTGLTTSIRSDQRLPVKQLAISAIIAETGTWTYTIDRYNGDPQPHFIQVMATPKSATVVLARAWIRTANKGDVGPMVLYVEVKKGELPVSAALVEATVTRPDVLCNSTGNRCRETFQLFDTGSGDPDVTKGDGVYTRYFNVAGSGKGAYKFDIVVTDNGNTAYTLADNYQMENDAVDVAADDSSVRCCGSYVPCPSKQPLTPFQRVMPTMTFFVQQDQVDGNRPSEIGNLGRIGDVRAELIDFAKVRLSWTSPDMGGIKVARYEVKYSLSHADVVDNFETACIRWEHDQPFAFSIGDDTSMTMNISVEPSLIGKRIFVALRAYSELTQDARAGPVSNVVTVYIPRPAPPSTVRPVSHHTDNFFDFAAESDDDEGSLSDDDLIGGETSSKASLYDLNWDILIPIIVGIFLVAILIIGFCYFCIVRRQKKLDFPKKQYVVANDKHTLASNVMTSPVHSMPHHTSPEHTSTPVSQHQQQQSVNLYQQQQPPVPMYPSELDMPDHHTIGLPIYSSEEEIHKKRYSIVNDQEHQLIQQNMKHQHVQRVFRPCAVSVISNNNTLMSQQNGRMFGGPYDSWTPSQLLQDHEQQSAYDELINQNVVGISDTGYTTMMNQQQHNQADQYSLLNGHQQQQQKQQLIDQMSIHNGGGVGAPLVPPLPYSQNSTGQQDAYSTNIYSTDHHNNIMNDQPMYVTSHRHAGTICGTDRHPQNNQFNTSLQGSMNSVHSGDKKKTRNVTMV